MSLLRSAIVCAGLGIWAACRPPVRQPAVLSRDYAAVRVAAEREVMRGDSLRIERLRLGELGVREDTLRFDITNEAGTSRVVGVSVRTEPGLWIRGAWQRGYSVALAAHERRSVALPYAIRRLTPEGRLIMSVGVPSGDSGRVSVEQPVIDRRFAIGRGNPAATDPRRQFDELHTTHFDIYAYRASPGARDIQRIADDREHAVRQIGDILGTELRRKILIVLYPDSATKVNETGHIGMGWATNDMIVEIYNDRQRLDPYHELAHIVAGQIGSPPAVLDEGFATYAAELLGADALEHLGHAGRKVDEATCDLTTRGKRVSLDSLLRLSEFGSSEAPGDVMYPQGASAVKFLIERYGHEKFRKAFAAPWGDPTSRAAEFARVFAMSPADADERWTDTLHCAAVR